jgi:hypothetical protein
MSKRERFCSCNNFGYGAPVSDIEAVSLLNGAWGTPDQRAMEQFEVIDITPEDILRKRWMVLFILRTTTFQIIILVPH